MLYNIYFSPTGGTKKVADILVRNPGGEVCEVDVCCDIEKMALQAEDVCLIFVPSFAGRVPQVAIERLKKISGNGAKVVLNCVYGNREWDDTLTELRTPLRAADLFVWRRSLLLLNTPFSGSLLLVVQIKKMHWSLRNLSGKSLKNLIAMFSES